jgi:Protein NO VEIN, C-terminal
MPLILVQNEVTADPAHDWDDVEGVHYHYPSKYKNKIIEGERFLYYIGVHRADGKRRPHGEYFGTGTIGQIWEDPNKPKSWYCRIEDYERFETPVPAKIDGAPFETGPSNLWRDGVRVVEHSTFDAILSIANGDDGNARSEPQSVDVKDVQYQTRGVIVPRSKRPPETESTKGKRSTAHRRSRRSKQIGDWGETLAVRYIAERFPKASNIIHREALNERPGWDIDYEDEKGLLMRVEVKSTTGAAFASITLTANELIAAQEHRDRYMLMLIAKCETSQPCVQTIIDPFQHIEADLWSAVPATYDVTLTQG